MPTPRTESNAARTDNKFQSDEDLVVRIITRHSLTVSRRYSGLDKNRTEVNRIKINRFDAFRGKSYTGNFTGMRPRDRREREMINVTFLSAGSSNRIIALCDGLQNIVPASSTRHHYEDFLKREHYVDEGSAPRTEAESTCICIA